MHAAWLVCLVAASPAVELHRIADDATLALALERSQSLAEQLLDVLPDNVKNSPRPRIKAVLADIRRDQSRLAGEGKNPVFEAGVFVQLQDSLNTIWKVAPKPGRWMRRCAGRR